MIDDTTPEMSENRNPRLRPEDRKLLLLDAARRVLASNGPRGFGLSAVAKEAGVAIGLIGHHFGGINGLLTELLSSVVAERPPECRLPLRDKDEAVAALASVLDRHFDPNYYNRANLMVWLPIYELSVLGDDIRQAVQERDAEDVDELVAILRVLIGESETELTGPAPVLFRSGAHVMRPSVRRPREISSRGLSAFDGGCRSR